MRFVSFFVFGVALAVSSCAGSSSDSDKQEEDESCGDGVRERRDEGCDDGNRVDGDGCSSTCEREDGYTCLEGAGCETLCGDGIVAGDELCDGMIDGQYCSADCDEYVGACGDGIVQAEFGEQCDIVDDGQPIGMGGSGTVDISGGSEGCTECFPTRGFLCDASANTCQQTGVDRSQLAHDYPREICEVIVGMWGGEGNTFSCTISGTLYDITPHSVTECTAELPSLLNETCTIGEFEDWVLGKSNCELYTGTSPCD